MSSLPQQAETLQRILEEEARQLARETGFIERERAFNGADCAQALILGWLQRPDERLEGFTHIFERREVSIRASGLSQRFTQQAATFMERVLERLSEVQRPRGGRRCRPLASQKSRSASKIAQWSPFPRT